MEALETRTVLSAVSLAGATASEPLVFSPTIVAGDPNGTPSDSPANRVDANTTSSQFAGVGSLFMQLRGPRGYICTGTVIHPQHVLTAGHCLDTNDDGRPDFAPDKVTFYLNYGGNLTHAIKASHLFVHPDYTGFNRPAVNDDLAVIRLSSPVPDGVPIYPLHDAPVAAGDTFTMVGYGRSGDGVNGYYVDASFSVKRVGQNQADGFDGDDDSPPHSDNEVYYADFDGPSGNGPLGGTTLGNDSETTLGGGDSGGPSFVKNESGGYELAANNTFTISGGEYAQAPLFGSGMGGILVYPYLTWIDEILAGGGGGDGGGGGGGNKGGGKGGGKPSGKGNSASLDSAYPGFLAPAQPETIALSPAGLGARPTHDGQTADDATDRLFAEASISVQRSKAAHAAGMLASAERAERPAAQSENEDDGPLCVLDRIFAAPPAGGWS